MMIDMVKEMEDMVKDMVKEMEGMMIDMVKGIEINTIKVLDLKEKEKREWVDVVDVIEYSLEGC